MNILIDTQSFIWFCDGNKKLPNNIKEIMSSKENNLKLSIASLWEITIKMSIEKLVLSWNIAEIIDLALKNGFDILPIKAQHLISLSTLEFLHKDPFDRMMIAQCIAEKLPMISSDGIFKEYPIRIIW